jgi:DNA-binding response OmpR family regulator
MVEQSAPSSWVLLVEDDLRIAKAISLTLAEEGIVTRSASDGQRALELARESRPALVLLDWRLPLMSGEEVAAALRELPGGSPPVVVLSASADIAATALRIGAQAHVRKPFDIDRLVQVVRTWMSPPAEAAAGDAGV